MTDTLFSLDALHGANLNMTTLQTAEMPSDSIRSPAAIPPRTSSSGISNVSQPPPRSALRPVIEADWLSGEPQRKRTHTHSSSNPSNSFPAASTSAAPAVGGHDHHARPSRISNNGTDPSGHISDDLIDPTRPTWTSDKEKILFGPFDYLFAHPGKDIRSELIAAFNAWLKVPPESLAIITKVVGMLHTASLLIDDVEDSSLLRRGIPVAHSIFGTPQTLNSSNYIYFVALRELQSLRSPLAITIYTEEMINLHRGQGMDLFWRDTLTCPSEADYLEMVGNKTGGLFRLAVKLMQAESPCPEQRDCVPLVNLIGMLFQIRDDYLNLSSTAYTTNKGLCEDLTEGKFSFPVIHSIRSEPGNLQLINILKQRSNEEEVKRYAVAYMEGTGSFRYCREVLSGLEERARKMVGEVDAGAGEGGLVLKILAKLEVE